MEENSKTQQFFDWVRENQIEHHHLTMVDFEEGRGLASQKKIVAGDRLIRVPNTMILAPRNLKTHPLRPILETHIQDDWSGLVILLMYEKNNPHSFFSPWLRLFPKEYDTPDEIWPSEVIELTRGTNIYSLIHRWKQIKKEGYKALDLLFDRYPHIFDRKVHTFKEFCWAADSVRSRSFEIFPQVPALIPLADMFNMRDFNIPSTPLSSLRIENDGVSIYLNYDLSSQTQIYITYGDKSNTDFLLHYGIILFNNPFDAFLLPVPEFQPEIPQLNALLKEKLGILDPKTYEFKLNMSPPPTKAHLLIQLCELVAPLNGQSTPHLLELILQSAIQNCVKPLEAAPSLSEDDEDVQTAIWYVKSQQKFLLWWKSHAVCLFQDVDLIEKQQVF